MKKKAPPYVIDNEQYHKGVAADLRFARRGLISPKSVRSWDGLSRRAEKLYARHLALPRNRRPRFPRIVTGATLSKYWTEVRRRKLA